jgi:hypothetical protein
LAAQDANAIDGKREAALTHVLAQLADVVQSADRRDAHLLGVVQAVGAAVRPVQAEPIADGSAEHFAHGTPRAFVFTSTSAFSIAAIACWIRPPGA